MKRFARLLVAVLTLAITAGLVWMPAMVQAGITASGLD